MSWLRRVATDWQYDEGCQVAVPGRCKIAIIGQCVWDHCTVELQPLQQSVFRCTSSIVWPTIYHTMLSCFLVAARLLPVHSACGAHHLLHVLVPLHQLQLRSVHRFMCFCCSCLPVFQ